MKERSKYLDIYRSGRLRRYGHTMHAKYCREPLQTYVDAVQPNVVIDCGTGHGEFCRWAAEHWLVKAIGIDFASFHEQAPNEIVWKTEYVGFVNGGIADEALLRSIDGDKVLLTSFDVLEHLTPEEVAPTLRAWANVSPHIFGTISHVLSRSGGPELQLHPVVQPREWWLHAMRAYFPNVVLTPLRGASSSYYQAGGRAT